MMKAEKNKDRIKEFFELSDAIFEFRKFSKPVLVYDVFDDEVRYSLWEEDMLERFGLKNVDGWDKTEELIFCPDWMQDEEEEDIDEDEIDEDC